ncbi:MAG: hypothetical protein WDO69_28515 [Pseudomonadota bacterium]
MKKTMLVATFLAVGAGSAGVSALSNIKMAGSDTLKDFTLTVITAAACPGSVGITYVGGGSGAGENALIASSQTTATQSTAPMSRFIAGTLSGAVCQVDTSKAEGIAFAADGLAIALSKTHITCDPNAASAVTGNTAADCVAKPPTGLRNSGTLATGYVLGGSPPSATVKGWQDVLRLVFLGLPNSVGKDPATPTTAATNNRDCNSAERQELVNNWGKLFETTCTTGNCTQLNHAWRRDLLSGTTDVFRELINAKLYPFCNTRFAFDPQPTLPATPPTKLALYPSPVVKSDGTPIFDDAYQDFDPIRRVCAGGVIGQGGALPSPDNSTNPPTQPDFPVSVAEQVCSPQGSLGVVLPIRPPVFSGQTVDQLYPTQPCLAGNLIFGSAPKIPGSSSSTLCPNGDVTFGQSASDYNPATGIITGSSNLCLVPATSTNDARCINGSNNFNAPLSPPDAGKILGNRRDGRVFNLHQYTQGGGYRLDTELGPVRSVVGNFSRIHTTRTLLATAPSCPGTGGDKRCCSQDDATSQIGCMTEADQCSFGFAGGEASAQVLTTTAGNELAFPASINNQKYDKECIVSAIYPLARKVYFNTLVGFENVNGQELELAKCFAGGVAGGSTQFASLLAAKNLFPLPTGPVCQDFANEGCSANNTAGDACANNPAGIPTAH